MTVYLAICDNNIADRKQLERLLMREKDRRLADNYDVLYIDSFGSEDALMATPVKYDMFFIDVTEGAQTGMEIAKKLRQRGIDAPVVLCESTINYSSYVNAPENIIYIEKPVNKGQVSHLVDVSLEWARRKIPLVEARCQNETRFIKHTELIRAIPLDSFVTRLCLESGEYLDISDSVLALEKQLRSYGCFIKCRKDLVNVFHITASVGNGFRLSNGDTVTFSVFQRRNILSILADNIRLSKPQQ